MKVDLISLVPLPRIVQITSILCLLNFIAPLRAQITDRVWIDFDQLHHEVGPTNTIVSVVVRAMNDEGEMKVSYTITPTAAERSLDFEAPANNFVIFHPGDTRKEIPIEIRPNPENLGDKLITLRLQSADFPGDFIRSRMTAQIVIKGAPRLFHLHDRFSGHRLQWRASANAVLQTTDTLGVPWTTPENQGYLSEDGHWRFYTLALTNQSTFIRLQTPDNPSPQTSPLPTGERKHGDE